MKQDGRKIVIVGGGIAGLCTAVYAQRCGYRAEVLEMHDMAGGLAMSWRRGAYTFETCLHWLYGSKPGGSMHKQWQEVCDFDKLTFVHYDELAHLETEGGEGLTFYTNAGRLEAELLKHSPQDAVAIRSLVSDIRKLSKFQMPDPAKGWASTLLTLLCDVPCMPLLRKLTGISCGEYGKRFKDRLIQGFFGDDDMGQLSAIALFFSLAWMGSGNADYPVGGSQALIRLIEEKLASLGGKVRFNAKVERILVENDIATGVELSGGETIKADWVISAADGYATIYQMLGGKYKNETNDKLYREGKIFPSYLQVSLGVARDLSQLPGMLTRLLDTPLELDPGTRLNHVAYRIFHFDPTFAPAGKTAVTCFLPTCNHRYWADLREKDPAAYRAEKHRVAEAVIDVLERKAPGIRQAIEVVDVSTPATVIRYTGNWKGSMEGWLLTPGGRMRPYPGSLPGLKQFLMVGQWIAPGGGLPSGLMTAREALQKICKQDGAPFLRT
jgi:phytoene dehydrogenase-like protein